MGPCNAYVSFDPYAARREGLTAVYDEWCGRESLGRFLLHAKVPGKLRGTQGRREL